MGVCVRSTWVRRSVAAGALIAGLPLTALAVFLAWPSPIDAVSWDAPTAPEAVGIWAPNHALREVEVFSLREDRGPEDVHVWRGGLVGGVASGRIVRWPLDGVGHAEVLVDTGGRPLGLHPSPEGDLYIADAHRGLLRLRPSGELDVLCDHAADGSRLVFTDDVDVAQDGTVWFSDASTRFGQPNWKLDLLENGPHGRLLRWHPDVPVCEVVVDGLYFANGVAVAEDDSFVLVNETSRYRVSRLWLAGERAGKVEVFVDDLPGFPDGISRGDGGVFFIALASPRNGIVDYASSRPWIRNVIAKLPKAAQPAPKRHPYVVAVDASGTVIATFQDPGGERYGMVTSAQQEGPHLYLGSLAEGAAARITLPEGWPPGR